jgi:hypothetical protein
VREVDLEAALGVERRDDRRGLVGADLPAGAAGLAVEMAMHGAGEDVVLLATRGTVAVADDPELLENVQRPVDRRGDRGRVALPAALHQLGAGDVALGLRQDLDERAALGRPAEPAVAEAPAD